MSEIKGNYQIIEDLRSENEKLRLQLDKATTPLGGLVMAVGNMKMPQTVADVALMMTVTLGPTYERAKDVFAALTDEQEPRGGMPFGGQSL
jgi:hypothetical protein